jgi:hypothetical protein
MKAVSSWEDAPAGATRCWFAPAVGFQFQCSLTFCMHPPSSFDMGMHGKDLTETHIPAANANSQCPYGMEMLTTDTAAMLRHLK